MVAGLDILFWYSYVNWLCAHHMFLKVNQVRFVLQISSKVMSRRKFKHRRRDMGKFGRGNSPHKSVCAVAEGLTLSLPAPEIISLTAC